jgi:hypothetical protein
LTRRSAHGGYIPTLALSIFFPVEQASVIPIHNNLDYQSLVFEIFAALRMLSSVGISSKIVSNEVSRSQLEVWSIWYKKDGDSAI